jgi:hypothetical protein
MLLGPRSTRKLTITLLSDVLLKRTDCENYLIAYVMQRRVRTLIGIHELESEKTPHDNPADIKERDRRSAVRTTR